MQSLGQLQETLSAAFGGPAAKPREERMAGVLLATARIGASGSR